jgi:hypothetical protein
MHDHRPGHTDSLERDDKLSAEDLLTFAVKAVFERWTALRLAIAGCWAGSDTTERVDDLIDDVIELCLGQRQRADGNILPYSQRILSSWLEDFFVEDCSADVEDGSIGQVAGVIDGLRTEILRAAPCPVAMWREVCPELAKLADRVRSERAQGRSLLASTEESSTSEGSLSAEQRAEDSVADNAMEILPRPTADNPSDANEENDTTELPLVDEDGFQLVVSRRHRRAFRST